VIAVVESQGKNILISDGGGWNPFTLRVDAAPLNDRRVRQALRLVADRPQMLEILFSGRGTLGNDVFGIWSADYDHSLPQRHQDIDQAKFLLKAAGQEGLTIQLVSSDIGQGTVQAARHFHNPAYIKLYQQAIATVDNSKRQELAHAMQLIDYTDGGYIIPFFPPVIDGYGANVNGLVPSKGGLSLNAYNFKQLWLS